MSYKTMYYNYYYTKLVCLHTHKFSFQGDTPLILASFYGHIDVVQLLIESKANINYKNKVFLMV